VFASFGPAAIVRFSTGWARQEAVADGKEEFDQSPTSLMNWQKQGADWKLFVPGVDPSSDRLRHQALEKTC